MTFARVLAILVLLGITAFCVFGFLATWEYPEASDRLPWQAGYGLIGVLCLGGVAGMVRRLRH
jgi:hypothetical protein